MGDRGAGHPGGGPDGARRDRPGARRGPGGRRVARADPDRGRQGQQRGRRARGGAPSARGGPRGRRARSRRGGARGLRASWWTASSAPASRESRASRWRARSPRSTPRTRRWWPATCPPAWTPRPARSRRRRSGRAVTVTFHGSKVGLHVAPGALHAGEVEVVQIGVPRGAPEPSAAGLISERVLKLYPHRTRDGSKFTSGVVVMAGGARGLTGAPTMAALSAQRAGAGYVQVAVPGLSRPSAAGGDDEGPAGIGRRPHARRRGAPPEDGGAGGGDRARARPGAQRRRGRVRARGGRAARTSRC